MHKRYDKYSPSSLSSPRLRREAHSASQVELLRAEVGQCQADAGGSQRQWEASLATLKRLCVELSQRLAAVEGGVKSQRDHLHQQVPRRHISRLKKEKMVFKLNENEQPFTVLLNVPIKFSVI